MKIKWELWVQIDPPKPSYRLKHGDWSAYGGYNEVRHKKITDIIKALLRVSSSRVNNLIVFRVKITED